MTEKPPYHPLKRAQNEVAKAMNHADSRVIRALFVNFKGGGHNLRIAPQGASIAVSNGAPSAGQCVAFANPQCASPIGRMPGRFIHSAPDARLPGHFIHSAPTASGFYRFNPLKSLDIPSPASQPQPLSLPGHRRAIPGRARCPQRAAMPWQMQCGPSPAPQPQPQARH